MNIYITVEHQNREFNGRLALALQCAALNAHVLIGEQNTLFYMATRGLIPPGTFYLKSIAPTIHRVRVMRELKAKGFNIATIDEEGGFLAPSYEEFLQKRFSKETVALADKIFCWGDFDKISVCQAFPEAEEKTFNLGNPRVDMWAIPIRKKTEQKNQGATPPKRTKKILIPTNVAGVVSGKGLLQDLMFAKERSGNLSLDAKESYIRRVIYSGEYVLTYLRLVQYIAENIPKTKIVVRPHPTESVEIWRELLRGLDCVEVQNSMNISEEIGQSDILIHEGCTTALEAYVAGLRVIRLGVNSCYDENKFTNIVSEDAFCLEDIYALLTQGADQREEISEETRKKIRYRVKNFGEVTATLDVAKMLVREGVVTESSPRPSRLWLLGLLIRVGVTIPIFCPVRIGAEDPGATGFLKIVRTFRRIRSKFPEIKKNEVEEKASQIAVNLGLTNCPSIKKHGPAVFEVKPVGRGTGQRDEEVGAKNSQISDHAE